MVGVEDAGVLDTADMLRRLANSVEEVPSVSCFRKPYRKQFRCLSRQIKLFAPMLDEVWERRGSIPEYALRTLAPLAAAIGSSLELFLFGNEGSKLYLVDLVHDQFKRAKYHAVDYDLGLYNDLRSIYNSMPVTDPAIINRAVENLQLNISELTQESAALHELFVTNGGAVPEETLPLLWL